MKADELRTALRRDDTRERFAHIYACTEFIAVFSCKYLNVNNYTCCTMRYFK